MALDEKVKEAIFEAVAKNNQSESLAQKIISLLDGLSNGSTNLSNQNDMKDYLKVILEAIEVKP